MVEATVKVSKDKFGSEMVSGGQVTTANSTDGEVMKTYCLVNQQLILMNITGGSRHTMFRARARYKANFSVIFKLSRW